MGKRARSNRSAGEVVRVAETRSPIALFLEWLEVAREHSRDARLAAHAARQSEPLEDAAALDRRVIELRDRYAGKPIPRPPSWGGYRVRPHAVEFLRFRENRLHERRLFTRIDGAWSERLLQP
jgi:pyridoxine/pyridoxamine 5'-phosphate oxidase